MSKIKFIVCAIAVLIAFQNCSQYKVTHTTTWPARTVNEASLVSVASDEAATGNTLFRYTVGGMGGHQITTISSDGYIVESSKYYDDELKKVIEETEVLARLSQSETQFLLQELPVLSRQPLESPETGWTVCDQYYSSEFLVESDLVTFQVQQNCGPYFTISDSTREYALLKWAMEVLRVASSKK